MLLTRYPALWALVVLGVMDAAANAFLLHPWTSKPGGRSRRPVLGRKEGVKSMGVHELRQDHLSTRSREGETDFEYLRGLNERLRVMSENVIDFLTSYWNEGLQCFSLTPDTGRVSITSTSFCVFTILDDFASWAGIAGYDSSGLINLHRVREALIQTNWTMDAFQTPVLISALALLRGSTLGMEKVQQGIHALLELRPDRNAGPDQVHSAYVMYWSQHALWTVLAERKVYDEILTTDVIDKIQKAVLESMSVASDEICRQMAYHAAGDEGNFDVNRLAYSLCTYYEGNTRAAPYVSNICSPTSATRLSMKIVEKALAVIFDHMSNDGLFPKSEPIFRSSSREAPGRDIGNAYVFAFDLLASLLEVFASEPELFVPHIHKLERALRWSEDNVLREVIADFCGFEPGVQVGGHVRKGWRSNHLGNEGTRGPLPWCTAQAFTALQRMRRLVKKCLTKGILAEFGGTEIVTPNAAYWNRLMDSDLLLQGQPRSFKGVLDKHFLSPLQAKKQALSPGASSVDHKAIKPLYSAVLYGPPGTAKTTVVTSMSYLLGWNFITIDTADFLAYGLQNIAARMTYIFDRLKMLEDCVILFDELDEFVLSREDKSLSMESRMLTTAMLTQLNDLRRQQRSVFFIATNRLRAFDAAIIRPGRFDAILLAGTPNLESRLKRLQDLLSNSGLSPDTVSQAMETFRPYFTYRFESHLQFLNWAENEGLMSSLLDAARTGRLGPESLEDILKTHASTATIRGAIRDEYLESRELSRL